MHQRQQNILYPNGDKFCEHNFLKLLINWQRECVYFVVGGVNKAKI